MVEWYTYAILTAVLVSFVSIISKKVLSKEHALEFSSVYAIFNFIISLAFIPYVDFNIPGNTIFLIYIASIFGTIAFLLVAKATRHMEVSSVTPLMAFGPAFILLSGLVFLGETITARNLFGIILLIIGAYVLEIDHKLHNILDPIKKLIKSKYVHYVLFALILYSVTASIDRFILNTSIAPINIQTYLFFIHLFIALNYIVIMVAFDKNIHGIKHGVLVQGKWIFLASLLIVLERFFLMSAISIDAGKVALVNAIKKGSVLITILLAREFFNEHNFKIKLLAAVIILVGVFLIII